MKVLQKLSLIAFTLIFLITGCTQKPNNQRIKMMQKKLKKFVPTEIKYNKKLLNKRQQVVLRKLYKASKLIDEIYLEQVYSKNFEIRNILRKSSLPEDKLTLKYFNIMFGPFDRLDEDKPFWGEKTKPAGANFYPEDMTKEEFEKWIKEHPADEKAFTSAFTIIRRVNNKLVAIPYSQAYRNRLTKISELMREAARYADNPTLRKYLISRAKAFLTNDYFQSDMDWMDLKDNDIEVIIGPYEVYEDGLFNYKASFESFLTIVDPEETAKLKKFARYLNAMEENLPIADKYKNFTRGNQSPIKVVQEVYCAGDAKAGIQTLAFNLPNDERVRKAKGSKKVLLKNIHEAKFKKLLLPIAERVLTDEDLNYVTFNAFFNHTLMHEMSHGLGPGIIIKNGQKTTVNKELRETYSTLEECKADVLGILNNIFMIKKKEFPKSFEKEIWTTFLAGIFRSVRFGINEAHGGGNAIIYNFMLNNGGYIYHKDRNKVEVDFSRAYPILRVLASRILLIQATGDYKAAKNLIREYAVVSPSMKALTAKLTNLPVDILPVFQIEEGEGE